MKHIKFFLVILTSLFSTPIFGQKVYKKLLHIGYTQEVCEVQYDNIINNIIDIKKMKRKNCRQINFNDGFENDSVIVYCNDKLIYSKRITTDLSLSFADNFLIKNVTDSSFFYLTISMPEKHMFFELPFDNRYYFLKLWYLEEIPEKYNRSWVARFTNNVPLYY